MTLAKGIYLRARKETKNSALCPQLTLKILCIWGSGILGGDSCLSLSLVSLPTFLVFVERHEESEY